MLEFLEVQEEYIKDEQRNLKKEYLHAQEEVKRIQSVPLVIGQFLEAVDQNTGIGMIILATFYLIIYSVFAIAEPKNHVTNLFQSAAQLALTTMSVFCLLLTENC